MKKVNLFSMVTALLLAATSCSDDIDNGGNKPGEPIDGNGVYLTVNIVTPSAGGAYTKAPGDKPTGGENGDGYLTALEKEYKVGNVTIVLYGKTGATEVGDVQNLSINDPNAIVIASSYASGSDVTSSTGSTPNHETQGATVYLNSELLKKDTYYRILAITNAGNLTGQFPAGAKLADCKIKTINERQNGTGADERFVMSTHQESYNGTYSMVKFTDEHTTKNNAAKGTAWVERLSARIDYVGNTTDFTINDAGGNLAATIKLLGVAPVNVATHKMNIFKHLTSGSEIDGALTALAPESYTNGTTANYVIEPTTTGRTGAESKVFDNPFANSDVSGTNFANFDNSFKQFDDTNWTTESSTLTPTDGTGSASSFRIITYAGENTMSVNDQTHGNTTGVIFKAKYDPEKLWVYNESDGKLSEAIKPFTTGFYRVNNKLYQELEAAEAEMIFSGSDDGTSPLAWLRKNFTSDAWMLSTGITLEGLKAAVASAAANNKDLGYFQFLNGLLSSATDLSGAASMNWNAFMTTTGIHANNNADNQSITVNTGDFMIEYYGTSHTCYYPYWIRHANNGVDDTMGIMEFAIVRNNVYRLSVTSIETLGLANPFDSDDKKNEGEDLGYYLKVELYVHDWVVRDNEGIIFK